MKLKIQFYVKESSIILNLHFINKYIYENIYKKTVYLKDVKHQLTIIRINIQDNKCEKNKIITLQYYSSYFSYDVEW